MPPALKDDLQFLKGVGPARADDFSRLGIHSVRDLLFTFPRDIADRSNVSSIAGAPDEGEAVFIATVTEFEERKPRGGRLRSIVRACLSDGTGEMEAVWFNAPWVLEKLHDATLLIYGKVKKEHGRVKLDHPQFEVMSAPSEVPALPAGLSRTGAAAATGAARAAGGTHTAPVAGGSLNAGRIVPVYPCTGALTQNVWRKVMDSALRQTLPLLPELYPPDYMRERQYLPRAEAVRNMHFPESEEARQAAWQRLAHDECLLMQLAICARRRSFENELPSRKFNFSPELHRRIRSLFPFRMTAAQERVVSEIVKDMQRPVPMHRLLQGDVGSGKTAVAIYAMLAAVAGGAQVCLMAPTGLLARQHFDTLTAFLANSTRSKVRVRLLISGLKKNEREILKGDLASKGTDILIATHAALQKDMQFADLGLVIIDEQHKFGVDQRTMLVQKGIRPDTLIMTATPIPRSLALTVYGDLDVSVIDELPPGRKPVKTSVPAPQMEGKVWDFVRTELVKGRQAYVVSPLLEENEELDLTSAKEAFLRLQNIEFARFKVGLMHGKMTRDEQHEVMSAFRERRIDLLVSTVVIEVGVDVPNANTMVVLHAERFGLAQLHQLRGRIGRGQERGHFILLSEAKTEEARRRLLVLSATSDGFKIAEEDLRMRGPGEFLGTKQHGLPELKLVDIARDMNMILQARQEALELLPELPNPRFSELCTELKHLYADTIPGLG